MGAKAVSGWKRGLAASHQLPSAKKKKKEEKGWDWVTNSCDGARGEEKKREIPRCLCSDAELVTAHLCTLVWMV
jgi:hypothetical protein